jgi:PilZ domain
MNAVQRARIKRPLIIYVIIAAYVAAPLVNAVQLQGFTGVSLGMIIQRMYRGYGPLASFWFLTAPLVGIGFYFVHAVSWYLFVGHSSLILADYALKWLTRPWYYLGSIGSEYHVLMLIGNVLLVAAVAFVVRKNFRSPYFQALPRSWRERTRIAMHHVIVVNGQVRRTTDISATGCFVADPRSDLAVADHPTLRFESDTLTIECQGEVVRRVQGGYGVRFASLPGPERRDIKRMLKRRFPLRYQVDIGCTWTCRGAQRPGRLLNVSRGGCYMQTEVHDVADGTAGEVRIDDLNLILPAEVVWVNAAGRHEKPSGIGCRFSRRQAGLVRMFKRRYGKLGLTR